MNRPVNPQTLFPMADVQATSDERQLAIDQVGIKGLRYPLYFADADGQPQPTIADCNVSPCRGPLVDSPTRTP